MGREFELKFSADAESFAALGAKWEDLTVISMETTYFDTPAGDLSRRHITLRRRMENGVSVCTVKTPDGGCGRGEWELECENIKAAVPMLCKLGAPESLLALTREGLVISCGARFTRRAKLLTLDGCTVEIALDEGVLLGGGRELPLREVEVELKAGDQAVAVAFAQALAAMYHLQPEEKSKFARAQKLAKGE
ncbi:MAG: CYTH domain-containing protein [Oscillospiraceae bacterium]|nr:CYTH domain-containing protein [Oscillospiraceae bacterium]